MNEADNLYPTNGEYFTVHEPKEQVIERKKEKAAVLEAKKLAEKMLARWEEKVAFYDAVSSIKVDINTAPEDFLKAWLHAQEVKQTYEEELNWLREEIEPFQR